MNACVDLDRLIVEQPQAQAERQRLAEMLGCLTEEQVALLADVDVSTVRNWRVRKTGPESRSFGRSRLYPLTSLKEFLSGVNAGIAQEIPAEPSPAAARGGAKKAAGNGRRHFVDLV